MEAIKLQFNRPPPNSDAQILIDAEITKYEAIVLDQDTTEAVRALKTRRNNFAPISRLPAEILSHIFIVEQPEFPGLFHQRFRNETNILGVCRYWNETAMNTSQLWSNFDLFYPFSESSLSASRLVRSARRMDELLNRAKSSPLSIRCRLPEYGGQALRLMDLGNVEKLWIYSQTAGPLSKVIGYQSKMSSPPPLKTLSIILPIKGVDRRPAPSNLIWTNTSSLQSLTLTGFAKLDDLPTLPCLKNLTLGASLSVVNEGNLTIAWLVRSLVNTPAIESIDVSSFSPNTGTNADYPPSDLRVSLPRLKHFRVIGLDPNASLFTHLEIPPSAVIYAHCIDAGPEELLDWKNYQSTIERFTKWNGDSAIERIIITSYGPLRIDIYSTSEGEGDNPIPLPHLSLGVIGIPSSATDSSSYLADLCHALPLSCTRRLSLYLRHSNISEQVYLDPWVELLHGFTHIRRLDIYGPGHILPLLKGLFKPPYDDVLCNSALEVVNIIGLAPLISQHPVPLKYLLEDMIRERVDAGAPLKEIRLSEGLLKGFPLKNVEELVSVVYASDAALDKEIPKFPDGVEQR